MRELRVWWVPQLPMRPFHVQVGSPDEAMKILTILAEYDAFQFENNVKPDYCNMGGLEVYEDGEWCEWHDEYGRDIEDLLCEQPEAA